jgi:hypothetical protein
MIAMQSIGVARRLSGSGRTSARLVIDFEMPMALLASRRSIGIGNATRQSRQSAPTDSARALVGINIPFMGLAHALSNATRRAREGQ